jgi:hypothetical protein
VCIVLCDHGIMATSKRYKVDRGAADDAGGLSVGKPLPAPSRFPFVLLY